MTDVKCGLPFNELPLYWQSHIADLHRERDTFHTLYMSERVERNALTQRYNELVLAGAEYFGIDPESLK